MTFDNASPILGDCHGGDSICINGCCLTVIELSEDSFKVNLANETLERTDLGKWLQLSLAGAAHTSVATATTITQRGTTCPAAM